jgi:hypothetical protein
MKLENFILEEEISDASVSDIAFEQAVANLNVVSSLLDCYDKEEAIVEYLTKQNIDAEVYMEGNLKDIGNFLKGVADKAKDTVKEKVDAGIDKAKSTYKDKSEKAKIWLKNLIKMLIVAVDKFIDSLSHVNFKKLATRVEDKYPDGKDFSNKINPILFWTISHSAEYTKKLLDFRAKDSLYATAPQELQKMYDKFCDEIQHVIGDDTPDPNDRLTKSLLIKKLEKADADQKNIIGIRTLIKKLNLEDFDVDKDDECVARIERAQSMRKQYEDFAKAICKCYLDSAKEIKKLVKAIGSKNEGDVEPTDMSKFASKSYSKSAEDDRDNSDFREIDEEGNPI